MYKYLAIVMALFCHTAFSQTDLSLEDAIKKGLENNFDIRISKKDLAVARINNNWGTAGRYPNISLSLANMNSKTKADSRMIEGQTDEYTSSIVSPGVSMQWTLFNGFSVNITKQKLAYLENLSEGFLAIMVENSIQSIILGYYSALLEQEKLNIVEDVMSLSRDRYNYMLTKKELGAAVTYEVLQAKNSYLNDSSTYLMQKLSAENSIRNLNLLLGEAPGNLYNLTENFEAELNSYNLDTLSNKMLADNKTLQNQYVNLKMLENDIRLKRSSMFPRVSLSAGADYSRSRMKYKGEDANSYNSMQYYGNFTLSWTLYGGGNIKRSIQIAQIEQESGEIALAQMKLKLNNALYTTYEMYEIRKQLYNVALETIEAAQMNLDISNEKYKAGTINSFNYRDVQLIYLNAAFSKLQAIYNLFETHTELLRMTGGIITETL